MWPRSRLDLGAGSDACLVDVAPGSNLEERARDARYEALESARIDHGATAVLVAHTADDQAETVLLNVLRGAASAGLSGHARAVEASWFALCSGSAAPRRLQSATRSAWRCCTTR